MNQIILDQNWKPHFGKLLNVRVNYYNSLNEDIFRIFWIKLCTISSCLFRQKGVSKVIAKLECEKIARSARIDVEYLKFLYIKNTCIIAHMFYSMSSSCLFTTSCRRNHYCPYC